MRNPGNPTASSPGILFPVFIALALALVLALGGCAGGRFLRRSDPGPRRVPPDTPRAAPSVESPRPHVETGPAAERVVRSGRYILFRLHWTRAEDMAATLAPILQAGYGPGAAVVPHAPSNTLIFR